MCIAEIPLEIMKYVFQLSRVWFGTLYVLKYIHFVIVILHGIQKGSKSLSCHALRFLKDPCDEHHPLRGYRTIHHTSYVGSTL